jgi:hypothetical protein
VRRAGRLLSNVLKHQQFKPGQSKQALCAPTLTLEYSDVTAIVRKFEARVTDGSDRDSWLTACRDWCDLAVEASMNPANQEVLFRYARIQSCLLVTGT